MAAVLDASVLVASLVRSETHHERARLLLAGYPVDLPFEVPLLFRVEVIAALARRGHAPHLLAASRALCSSPRFRAHPIEVRLTELATAVAERARIRAYDAVYVALALHCEADLVTLDDELCTRVRTAYPTLPLVT